MPVNQSTQVKKVFLYALIISVVLSAVLGMIGIVRGGGDWLELRILLTTMTISGASICGLACGAYLEKRTGKVLPIVGVCLAIAAGILIIVALWAEPHADDFYKVTAIVSTFGVACAHLSLLSMARLGRRFSWSKYLSYFFVLGVAFIISWIVINESRNSDLIWRVLAIMTIGAAAITVLTPIFHWLSRNDYSSFPGTSSRIEEIDREMESLRARIAELEKQRSEFS